MDSCSAVYPAASSTQDLDRAVRELGGAVGRVASVPPVSADLPSTPHDDLDTPDASSDNFEIQDFSRFLTGVSNLVLFWSWKVGLYMRAVSLILS